MTAVIKKTVRTTYIINDTAYPDVDFEVSFEPYDNSYIDSIHILKASDTRAIIGYLSQDDNAQDPLEHSDGMGKIYSSHRHSNTQGEMQKALGFDSDWSPDIDLIFNDVGNRQLVDDAYIDYFVDNTSALELSNEGYESHGKTDFEIQIACAEADLTKPEWNMRYEAEYNTIKERFWVAGRNAGTIGAPYTISLDVYDHSGQSFSISGTGMQCKWDTARGGAVWVPDPCCLEHIMSKPEAERQATAIECCNSALTEYNAWLCGDTYGVCIATCDLTTGEEIESDECWGYYTSEYAVQALKENLAWHVKNYKGEETA